MDNVIEDGFWVFSFFPFLWSGRSKKALYQVRKINPSQMKQLRYIVRDFYIATAGHELQGEMLPSLDGSIQLESVTLPKLKMT